MCLRCSDRFCRNARHRLLRSAGAVQTLVRLVLTLLVGAAGFANADVLNMPGNGIANTIIQAEMHRGAQVAFKCSVGMYSARQVQSCLEKAIDGNLKSGTASDAFRLGLYFNAWRLARINAELRGDPDWTYTTICDVMKVQKYR